MRGGIGVEFRWSPSPNESPELIILLPKLLVQVHVLVVEDRLGQLKKIIRLASFFSKRSDQAGTFLFLLFIFSDHIRVGHNQSNLPLSGTIQCESVTTTWITSVTGMSTFSCNRTRTVTSENCHNPSRTVALNLNCAVTKSIIVLNSKEEWVANRPTPAGPVRWR
jgi:hypothetical protein